MKKYLEKTKQSTQNGKVLTITRHQSAEELSVIITPPHTATATLLTNFLTDHRLRRKMKMSPWNHIMTISVDGAAAPCHRVQENNNNSNKIDDSKKAMVARNITQNYKRYNSTNGITKQQTNEPATTTAYTPIQTDTHITQQYTSH